MTEYQEVKEAIQVPKVLRHLSAEEIGLGIEKYPHSAGLHIALALKLHDDQDIRFSDALSKAAARTISRTQLKFLIEGPLRLQFEWIPTPPQEEIELEEESTLHLPAEDIPDGSLAESEEFGGETETHEIQPELVDSEEVSATISENNTEEEGERIEVPKVNAFGFSFVRVKSVKKKPKTQEPFDIQKIAARQPIKPKKTSDQVIEKFLEATPSISSPRIDFGGSSPQPDLSASSTSLNEEIVTENMALIYLKQRNFEKALEIYRRLQLKFPEKSAFFAALIKNIENTIV